MCLAFLPSVILSRNSLRARPGAARLPGRLGIGFEFAPVQAMIRIKLMQCGGFREAGRATCGAERVVGEGSPDGRTSKT
jgi:hypothetical protein